MQQDIEQQPGFAPREIDRTRMGKTEAVIIEKEPILHKTRAEEEAWYGKPRHRQYRQRLAASHLAVPMLIGDRVIGVIAIYDWVQEYAYNEQDMEVLMTMASQAISEARTFVDVTRPRPELEAATEDGPPVAPVPTRRLSYQSGR